MLARKPVVQRHQRYSRVIREAANSVGGVEKLAAFLGVPRQQLARWATGLEAPPLEVFIAGLDVIAHGAFATERRIRVAVIESRHAYKHQQGDFSPPGDGASEA